MFLFQFISRRDQPAVFTQFSWTAVARCAPYRRGVCQVASSHMVFVQVWGYGFNFWGQLGLGDSTDRLVPEHLSSPIDIVQVSAGGDHTCVLDQAGLVWATGRNDKGQLGLGDADTRYSLEQLGSPTNLSQVAACRQHTMFVGHNGSVRQSFASGFCRLSAAYRRVRRHLRCLSTDFGCRFGALDGTSGVNLVSVTRWTDGPLSSLRHQQRILCMPLVTSVTLCLLMSMAW